MNGDLPGLSQCFSGTIGTYQYCTGQRGGVPFDADSLTDGYGQSFMEKTLVELQKAWIAYSAARCTFEEAQYRGGTGGSPAQLRCNMRTMAEQAAYLEENWIAP